LGFVHQTSQARLLQEGALSWCQEASCCSKCSAPSVQSLLGVTPGFPIPGSQGAGGTLRGVEPRLLIPDSQGADWALQGVKTGLSNLHSQDADRVLLGMKTGLSVLHSREPEGNLPLPAMASIPGRLQLGWLLIPWTFQTNRWTGGCWMFQGRPSPAFAVELPVLFRKRWVLGTTSKSCLQVTDHSCYRPSGDKHIREVQSHRSREGYTDENEGRV
jgi:hypothetical protein